MKNNTAQQGFSLLEVLIAFAILALSVGILLKVFSGGANTALLAEEYTAAVQIAESLMAAEGVETPLKTGEITGFEDTKYTWWVRVRPYQFSPSTVPVTALDARQLMKVDVVVSWGEEGRELRLSTLKMFINPDLGNAADKPDNNQDQGNESDQGNDTGQGN